MTQTWEDRHVQRRYFEEITCLSSNIRPVTVSVPPVLVSCFIILHKVGFYSDPSKGWVEGVAILCAVLIVAVVTATNDYSKDKQFRALNAVKDDVTVQASLTSTKKNRVCFFFAVLFVVEPKSHIYFIMYLMFTFFFPKKNDAAKMNHLCR